MSKINLFRISILCFLFLQIGLQESKAQQEVYKFSIEPFVATSKIESELTLPISDFLYNYGLRFNRRLTNSFSYQLEISGGKLTDVNESSFNKAATVLNYRFDNGKLLNDNAFLAPYISAGISYIDVFLFSYKEAKPTNDWNVKAEAGVKFRLGDRFNLLAFYSADVPFQYLDKTNPEYLQSWGASIRYNWGLRKSKLKAPNYYVNEGHEKFNNAIQTDYTTLIVVDDSIIPIIITTDSILNEAIVIEKDESKRIKKKIEKKKKSKSKKKTEIKEFENRQVFENKQIEDRTFNETKAEKKVKGEASYQLVEDEISESIVKNYFEENELITPSNDKVVSKISRGDLRVKDSNSKSKISDNEQTEALDENVEEIQNNSTENIRVIVAPIRDNKSEKENQNLPVEEIDSILNEFQSQKKLLNRLIQKQRITDELLNRRFSILENKLNEKQQPIAINETAPLPTTPNVIAPITVTTVIRDTVFTPVIDTVYLKDPTKTVTKIVKPKLIELLFQVNTYVVLNNQVEKINLILSQFKSNPNSLIIVSGFSDSQGDADYNLKLSKRRVETVQNYLIKNLKQQKKLLHI